MSDNGDKILRYFKRNRMNTGDIKYITRADKKTCIFLTDERILTTYITVRDFYNVLEAHGFICINKGTVVSKRHISFIENGDYHMIDGAVFQGRRRTVSAHKKLNELLHQHTDAALPSMDDIRTRFSVLDNMPIAFCIVELVFNENGTGIDFVFRYCNKQMEIVEGKTIDEMLNHSFYKVFPDADRKWLAAYTDVAVNGVYRHIRDYSPEIGKELFVRCYQPAEGFCACLLTLVDDLTSAEPAVGM